MIQALSALTIQEPQRVRSEEPCTTLSPITEEKPGLGAREFSNFGTGERASGGCGMGTLESDCFGTGERESGSFGMGERVSESFSTGEDPAMGEQETWGLENRDSENLKTEEQKYVRFGNAERESGSSGMGERESEGMGTVDQESGSFVSEEQREVTTERRESVENKKSLSWTSEDITEVTFTQTHSASKADSSVISVATNPSQEMEGESYSVCPESVSDINDSDNPVFSPEPMNTTQEAESDSHTNMGGSRMQPAILEPITQSDTAPSEHFDVVSTATGLQRQPHDQFATACDDKSLSPLSKFGSTHDSVRACTGINSQQGGNIASIEGDSGEHDTLQAERTVVVERVLGHSDRSVGVSGEQTEEEKTGDTTGDTAVELGARGETQPAATSLESEIES